MALGKTIRLIRKGRGMTLDQLEQLSGVKKGTISALEIRDSGKSDHFPPIADALGLSMDDLLAAGENIPLAWLQPAKQSQAAHQDSIHKPSSLLGAVTEIPLLNKDNTGMYREYLDGKPPPATHNYHSRTTSGLFAYSVEDDVMEPKIPKGCKAIINTKTKPAHGMFVLIQDGSTAYIRSLVVDGPTMLAKSPHTSRPMPGPIIGVVQELAIWMHDLTGEET